MRSNAIFVLGQVRTKDDMRAEMIKAAVSCGTSVAHSTLDHLAPHPDSEMLIHSLIAGADVEGLERLVRRRRCAGLSTDPTRLRPLLRETIALPKGRILDRSDQKVNAALRVVGDLGDRELLEAGLARLEYPDNDGGVYKALRRLLTIFGQSAIDQAADIQAGVKGRHAEQLGWVLEGPPRVTAHYTVDQGDELFGTGKIDTTVSCAFGVYGEVLLYDPSCAHAAFQLAWIDRAFGSPSGPGRIDWIRGLGFADSEFLVDLARPAAEPLGGHRFLWKPEPTLHDPTKLAEFGHRAERAGLYGLASTIYIAASNENSAHWDAFIRAVKEGGSHYRRVCAACGSQPLY